MLTLMKGDKCVESLKKTAYCLLLFYCCRHFQIHSSHLLSRNFNER